MLVAIADEAWLRATSSFAGPILPTRFVPGVGVLIKPHAEVRHTNGHEFWTVQRANSLGFLDREPPDPARAAASCHVAVIGDSFVEAREVAIADKLHVRLEALAAAELPQLDVTASAYGFTGMGQASQLPLYDRYARATAPNLVVLVFYRNDFLDNSAVLDALDSGWDAERMPWAYPERAADGAVRLRPPHPEYAANGLHPFLHPAHPLSEHSLFALWLDARLRALDRSRWAPPLAEHAEALAARPGYEWILDGWNPRLVDDLFHLIRADDPPPLFAEAREFTAWALAEFRRRADRDGAALAILSTHHMGLGSWNALLLPMADGLGIPVIDQLEWIKTAGGRHREAKWRYDEHWTPQGHQWAAEAILDWLRRHPEVCED